MFVKDGRVVREEVPNPRPDRPGPKGFPDDSPRAATRGGWSAQLDAGDRLLHPMRRVGQRGSGEWEQISWDEALDAVADGLIDAIAEYGPRTILREGTPEMAATVACERLMGLLGGTSTDVNGALGDFAPGLHLTIGHSHIYQDEPSFFLADTIVIWHTNPVYTYVSFYHYLTEARYHGAEVVLISPDVSPSHTHTDYHLPVVPGSDPALALAMCQVIVEEGLVDEEFVRNQTDLALLVRADTQRFLRASDLDPGGQGRPVLPPRRARRDRRGEPGEPPSRRLHTVARRVRPRSSWPTAAACACARSWVRLRRAARRVPARARRARPPGSTPTRCAPSPARSRAAARGYRMGMGSNKAYHSDLYQRTMLLLLALTGNWGGPGTGFQHWANAQIDGWMLTGAKRDPAPRAAEEILGLLDGFARCCAQTTRR